MTQRAAGHAPATTSDDRLHAWPDGAGDNRATAGGSATVGAAGEDAADPGDVLRRHGLRLTAQRLAVLRALARHPHGTADDLHGAVRADLGTVSRQTVYDVLAALADHGIVRRVQPAGSPARFENRAGDNHHHLICRRCGRMTDVDCAVGDIPCLIAADDAGYEVDEAEVIYWGRCPRCREAAEADHRSATASSTPASSATASSATASSATASSATASSATASSATTGEART